MLVQLQIDYQAVTETLALVYLALARACALQGDSGGTLNACHSVFSAAKLSLSYLEGSDGTTASSFAEEASENGTDSAKKRGAQGGKRGWKHHQYGESVGGMTFRQRMRRTPNEKRPIPPIAVIASRKLKRTKILLKTHSKGAQAFSRKQLGENLLRH